MKRLIVMSASACLLFLAACEKEKVTIPDSPANISVDGIRATDKDIEDAVKKYRSVTTGMPTDVENGQHFSVMIENSPDARPQSGLSSADIVYEVKTEGNITRYLAFFHDDIPSKVGPVRSSRHYFIPIAEGVQFPYIHFGGSPQAYSALANADVPTIDGIKKSKYFMRDSNRKAPHNAYLLTDQLEDYQTLPVESYFYFSKDALKNGQDATNVSLSYNAFTNLRYEWDSAKKGYQRFQQNEPHVDKEGGEPIYVQNILIQKAAHAKVPGDTSGRIDVDLSGNGELLIISNGMMSKGKWSNESGTMNYFDEDGKDLTLNKGKTWVQVVDYNQRVHVE